MHPSAARLDSKVLFPSWQTWASDPHRLCSPNSTDTTPSLHKGMHCLLGKVKLEWDVGGALLTSDWWRAIAPPSNPGCGWIKFVFFNSSSGPKKEGTRDPWLSLLYCAAKFFPLHSLSREQPLPPHYSASLALVSCSQLGQPLAEHQPFDLTLFATAGLSPKREQYALAIWPGRPRRPEQPRVLWGAAASGDCLPTSLARRVPCFCLFANQPFKIQIQATLSDSENHK